MLEHHANAEFTGKGGTGHTNLAGFPENLAFKRLQRAEQHFYKRRFSSTILPQQRVNFTAVNGQINLIAGFQRAKLLCQALYIQQLLR